MELIHIVTQRQPDIRGGQLIQWAFASEAKAQRWAVRKLDEALVHDGLEPVQAGESLDEASDRLTAWQDDQLCNADEEAGYVCITSLELHDGAFPKDAATA